MRAFKRGLETSRNVGSLLLFFDYVGWPTRKKILRFWTESSLKSNIYSDCWWDKSVAQIFPPKDLVYFWLQTIHHSIAQTFFSKNNFPAKRLKFFTNCFSAHFKSAKRIISSVKNCFSAPYKSANRFPPKDLVFSDFFLGQFHTRMCYCQ